MKTSHTLLGLVGAAALGTVLGVLFAPDKGSNTRKKIADKSKDGSGRLKGKFSDLMGALSETGNELLKNGKSKYEEVKEDARHGMKEVSNEIKKATN